MMLFKMADEISSFLVQIQPIQCAVWCLIATLSVYHTKQCHIYRQRQGAAQKYHTRVLKLTSVHSRQVVSKLSSAASGMSLGLCFWHNFSGMERTCWTTGSWWCCLSLEIVILIPAGSTIIYWLLLGFICVFLCQSIKIKPTTMVLDIRKQI